MNVDRELLALGREVRRLRIERDLSQEELADLSGLHRNYVGGIERGERNVGVKAIFSLARAFKLPVSNLFAGYDAKLTKLGD